MSDVMTLSEIEASFPNEWILIGDPQTDEQLTVLSGRVLFHSPDRDAMYAQAVALRPGYFATHFTGRVPAEGAAILI